MKNPNRERNPYAVNSSLMVGDLWFFVVAFVLSFAGSVSALPYPTVGQDDLGKERVYSPYAGRDYADRVFFGDMHFHTDSPFDTDLIGTRLDVHDGYRMAHGDKVNSNTGQPVQLIRPLDFLVITDHSEMIGLAPAFHKSHPLLLADPWGKWIHDRFNAGEEGRMEGFQSIIEEGISGINPFSSGELTRSFWLDFVKVAEVRPPRFVAQI